MNQTQTIKPSFSSLLFLHYENNHQQLNYNLIVKRNKSLIIQFYIFLQMQGDLLRIGKYTSKFGPHDCLGSGGFSSVFLGYQIKNPDNQVAIKVIDLKKSSKQQVQNEIKTMLNTQSQGTLKILGHQIIKFGAKKSDHFAIVIQKMDGSLRDLLEQRTFSVDEATKLMWKVIQCYEHLYDCEIIHRDLKPENILYKRVGEQIKFKIADFGLSKESYINKTKSMTVGKGTGYYISPQQARFGKYTNKTDVYALGCIFFELLNGSEKVPCQMSCVDCNFKTINSQIAKVLSKLGAPESIIEFIQKCLRQEQEGRYSWQDIFTHKIFQKVNKEKVSFQKHKEQKVDTPYIPPRPSVKVVKPQKPPKTQVKQYSGNSYCPVCNCSTKTILFKEDAKQLYQCSVCNCCKAKKYSGGSYCPVCNEPTYSIKYPDSVCCSVCGGVKA